MVGGYGEEVWRQARTPYNIVYLREASAFQQLLPLFQLKLRAETRWRTPLIPALGKQRQMDL